MALHNLLWTKPDSPYFKPPPLHICVVAMVDQPRVVSWEFQDSTVRPALIRKNKVAAISDGKTVTRVTLYEGFASSVSEGNSYMLRGHTLMGQSPPYYINISKGTMFFRSTPVTILEDLRKEGVALLHPASPLIHLSSCKDAQGFVTVEGEVVEVSTVKKIQSGREAIPLRKVSLKQDATQASLCLWREAALSGDLQLGSRFRISHLKCGNTDYGLQLQSTTHTTFESASVDCDGIVVLGVMEDETNAGTLKLLLEDNQVVQIREALWQPFEAQLHSGPLEVNIKLSGKTVTCIEAIRGQSAP